MSIDSERGQHTGEIEAARQELERLPRARVSIRQLSSISSPNPPSATAPEYQLEDARRRPATFVQPAMEMCVLVPYGGRIEVTTETSYFLTGLPKALSSS